jgi:hypothetical protein
MQRVDVLGWSYTLTPASPLSSYSFRHTTADLISFMCLPFMRIV